MVRNSVDHGIETPAEARRRGKNPEGRCCPPRLPRRRPGQHRNFRRRRAASTCERVREKRSSSGLITAEQAARMSEREAAQLDFPSRLFHRRKSHQRLRSRRRHGCGEDQHRENRRHGRCAEQSGPGHDRQMKIPLTLAIIPALIVTSGGDRYAIPQVSLLELVRLEGDSARSGIELHSRRARLPAARPASAARVSRSRVEPRRNSRREAVAARGEHRGACRRTSGSSAWWSMRSTTPRKSWSNRWANS